MMAPPIFHGDGGKATDLRNRVLVACNPLTRTLGIDLHHCLMHAYNSTNQNAHRRGALDKNKCKLAHAWFAGRLVSEEFGTW